MLKIDGRIASFEMVRHGSSHTPENDDPIEICVHLSFIKRARARSRAKVIEFEPQAQNIKLEIVGDDGQERNLVLKIDGRIASFEMVLSWSQSLCKVDGFVPRVNLTFLARRRRARVKPRPQYQRPNREFGDGTVAAFERIGKQIRTFP